MSAHFPSESHPAISAIDATLNLTQFRVEKQIYRQSTFHSGKNCRNLFLAMKLPSNKKISRLFGGVCSGEETIGTEITLKAKTSRSTNLTFATPLTKPLENQLNRSISSRRRSLELKKRETVLYPCLSTYRLFVLSGIASHESASRRRAKQMEFGVALKAKVGRLKLLRLSAIN